jgi:hypothetical protein
MVVRFPKFAVKDVHEEDGNLRLFGTVDATKVSEETWVGDQHLGYLFCGTPILYGRWHSKKNDWEFSVSDVLAGTDQPYEGRTIDVFDGYWGERAELVFDTRLKWSEKKYEKPGNHTHCFICWADIWSNQNSCFMASETNDDLCMECYDT